jgi:hypothetical protein
MHPLLNHRGETPSTTLLRQMIGVVDRPRRLTPHEIELLRKSKEEITQVVRDLLAADRLGGNEATSGDSE